MTPATTRTSHEPVVGLAAQAVATILNGLGVAVNAIAEALVAVFGLADQAVAEILNDIGIAADAIVQMLQDVFNDTLDEIQDIADAIGGAFADAVGDIGCILDPLSCLQETTGRPAASPADRPRRFLCRRFVRTIEAGRVQSREASRPRISRQPGSIWHFSIQTSNALTGLRPDLGRVPADYYSNYSTPRHCQGGPDGSDLRFGKVKILSDAHSTVQS